MADRTCVTLPDMFRGFIVQEPKVNKHYEAVKPVSEKWLARICAFSPMMQKRVGACDFSYFCSIAAPEAPIHKLRTMCDWGNWVFPFDDMFDSGDLRSDLIVTRHVLDSLLADMKGHKFRGLKIPVVLAHDDIYRRLSEVETKNPSHTSSVPKTTPQTRVLTSISGVQRRFARAMELYALGVAQHVQDFTESGLPCPQEMLETRRLSVGVAPLYHLVEYAHSIRLPDEVFEDPAIQTLERLGADMSEGCPFNMVAACRMSGQSAQEAFDTVGALLEDSYYEWEETMRQVPAWGGDVERDVQRYIKGIQDVVQANITWSFRSKRYLGVHAPEVRRTKKFDVMTHPPYLDKDMAELR
ncbi:hypothetical protein PoMZ_05304 [Pyricularia oryzae]|uniref:Terpene synthase n=1 Tax=Pyricularia oryzae TaxID=318829 RepID=A0A4P7NN91_PYROR|nr:hypothetical protein PoMZ_05304 [Pyricularia oryzae]